MSSRLAQRGQRSDYDIDSIEEILPKLPVHMMSPLGSCSWRPSPHVRVALVIDRHPPSDLPVSRNVCRSPCPERPISPISSRKEVSWPCRHLQLAGLRIRHLTLPLHLAEQSARQVSGMPAQLTGTNATPARTSRIDRSRATSWADPVPVASRPCVGRGRARPRLRSLRWPCLSNKRDWSLLPHSPIAP